jgi:hypothetical protein
MSMPLESEAFERRELRLEASPAGDVESPLSSVLPQTLGSRVALVLLNLLLIPGTALALRLLHEWPVPRAWQWRIVYYLFVECLLLFGAICVLSGLWGLYRAAWIARIFDGLYAKFFLILFASLLTAWLCMIVTR